ncbi:vitamin K epoxide reductase family protein [Nanoarchaeota archaeon]
MAKKKVKKKASPARRAVKRVVPGSKVKRLEKRVVKVERFAKGMVSEYAQDKKRKMESIIRIVLVLALLGLLISIYMTWLYFKPGGVSFCDTSEMFNCTRVAQSGYSAILGVPVALLGIFWYGFIILSCYSLLTKHVLFHRKLTVKRLNLLLVWFSIVGFVFSCYLMAVQYFAIQKWCVFCISSSVIVTLIMILSVINFYHCEHCKERLRKLGFDPDRLCEVC